MNTKARAFLPIAIVASMALVVALSVCVPQDALAKGSPWGAGTTYNAKSHTLTVKSGKHTIGTLSKVVKGKAYTIEKLVIKGGTTTVKLRYSPLQSLTVKGGKLKSKGQLSVSGKMKMMGGKALFSSTARETNVLSVYDDFKMSGGKITVKTTKGNCGGISVSGDMLVKKGTISITTKGKAANGLHVNGFLKNVSGKLTMTTKGKNAYALRVGGDLLMKGGSIKAKASRGIAIRCTDLLKVTGGKLSAQSAADKKAIDAGEKAVLKAKNLGKIKGQLPQGVQFAANGVTYRVTSSFSPTVSVVKGKTSAATVRFGGVSYTIGKPGTSSQSSTMGQTGALGQ